MAYRNKIVETNYRDQKPAYIDDRACALSPADIPQVPDELSAMISTKIDLMLETLEAQR